MPAASLKAMAGDLGIPLDKAEKLWDKAKKIAAGQGFQEGDDQFYAYTTGIVKKMMGVESSTLAEKLILLREDDEPMNVHANLEDLAAAVPARGSVVIRQADGGEITVTASGEMTLQTPAGLVIRPTGEEAKHSAAGADRARFLSVFMKAASGTRGKKLVAAFVNGNAAAFQAAWNDVSQQVLSAIPSEGASVKPEVAKGFKGQVREHHAGRPTANPIPPHRPGNHMPAKGKRRNQESDNEPMAEHSPVGKSKRQGTSTGPEVKLGEGHGIPPHRPAKGFKGKGRRKLMAHLETLAGGAAPKRQSALTRFGEVARKASGESGPHSPESQELKDDLTKYGKARAAGKNDPATKKLGEKIGKIRNAIRRSNSEHSETAGVNNRDQTARMVRSTNNIIDGAMEEYSMRGLTAGARVSFYDRLQQQRAALQAGTGVAPSVAPNPPGSPAGGPGNLPGEAPDAPNAAPMVEGAAEGGGDTDAGGLILTALQGAPDQTLTLKKLSEATGIGLEDLLDVLNGIEAPVNLALSPSDTVTLEQATTALAKPETAATETAGKYAVGDTVTVKKQGKSRPAKITKMAGIKIGVEYTDDDGGTDSVSYFNLAK